MFIDSMTFKGPIGSKVNMRWTDSEKGKIAAFVGLG